MEGVGSRLGRASSRYGPTATVFNGPVRKWKKKWVHVSSSSTVSYHQSQSNGQSNDTPRLLLCRWTPLPTTTSSAASATASGDESATTPPEEPPRRKFRYTPIAVLEEQKKVGEKKVENEAKTNETDQALPSTATTPSPPMRDEFLGRPDITDDFKEETEDSNISNLDLGLGLKGLDDNPDTISDVEETPANKASSSGFWSIV